MDFNLRSNLVIYSPVIAIMGYFLFLSIFIIGPYGSVALAGISFVGAVVFLNHIRDKSRYWWTGLFYPLLMLLIIIMELSLVITGVPVYGPGGNAGKIREMLIFSLTPLSLLFFAAMPAGYRKIMKLPIIFAAIIGVLMLIPLYDDISSVCFPPEEGKIYGSDITGGFIVMVFAGIYGMPALAILGIIMGLKLSAVIRSELNSGIPGDIGTS